MVPGSLDADPALNERTAELVARDVRPLLEPFGDPVRGYQTHRMATRDRPGSEAAPKPEAGATREERREPRTMIPGRERRRFKAESVFMRLVATGGIVAIGVVLGAILVSQDVAGWIVGLVIALVSVILSAILWSARQL